MSVAELAPQGNFERTPPQDVAAEQSVLGGMMLSKDAIADVVETVRGTDFYRPAHESIYDAIVDLYGRGEPADAVTVSAELTKRGELARIGGAPYLHTLISSVPTAANAGFYARIVRERAVLRKLVDAGTRIAQLGYATDGGDVDELVNTAQAEVYAVTERRTSEDYIPLKDILNGTMEEIDAASHRGEGMIGVPTGFKDLDALTNGLHPGQMIVVAARPAVGKALALDTPLPTPTGWTTMGEVQVGDHLLAADGSITTVVAATEVMSGRPCYEVTFDDGTAVVADAQHEWLTEIDGVADVRTTEVLAASRGVISVPEVAGFRGAGVHAAVAGGSAHKVASVVQVASVPVRCVEIDHPSHLYLASRSMIPTHNSTLGLDIARSASIKNGQTSVIFSLEMSRNEIAMRMLSAESQVPLQNLRKGNMRDEDWTRLARTMGKLSDAPLFVDDSPNMSLMEIRAKCRRLKQRHDLKLVIIDYLQLMSSGKRVESRQQEVSEFSRALKLLAKELEVPVIAISQLNRGSEQRTDKKPQMSDLRESGCLTADTRILRADTGAETTMGELFSSGAKDVPVWALDERLKYVRRHLTHVFSTGVKETFRLRLASGKEVTATANHPFLTFDGWTPLAELEIGSRVGSPRHVPAPERYEEGWNDERIAACARSLVLDRHEDASIPAAIHHVPKRQLALFLRTWWSRAGRVGEHGVSTTSPNPLVREALSRLLLRFGISTFVTERGVLSIVGSDDLRRFLQEIGIEGSQSASAEALLDRVRSERAVRSTDASRLPVWADVKQTLTSGSASAEAPAMAAVATLLDRDGLEVEAVNDLLWDEVVEITPVGQQEVFDATVVGTHNFIANGIAVHNSIEQDADVVILLHREDMYEKESPRAGEADMIVAKHRNGPTDTIVVAFQGHYARFFDMAQ